MWAVPMTLARSSRASNSSSRSQYVPGCPPTPEALYYGVLTLRNPVIKYETMAKKDGARAADGQRRAERDDARLTTHAAP